MAANTTPVAFDPKPRRLGVTKTYTAGSDILSGQIVAFAADGDGAIDPATSSLSAPVGVAAFSAAAGAKVTVYGDGSEVKVMLSTDNGTADQGDQLGVSTIAGCAIVQDGAIAAHEASGVGLYPIGTLQEDIAAGADTVGGTGYVILNMTPIWTATS